MFLYAQEMTIDESLEYLNQHLSDLGYGDEVWEVIEYNKNGNYLWIGMQDYTGYFYSEEIDYKLVLDGSFTYKQNFSPTETDYVTVKFTDNDVTKMYYDYEEKSKEFVFASYSDKTTKVFIDLLKKIQANSKK